MNTNKKGFTLLELLIVITIIAVLSTITILILNPAETLRKSRDSQRIADLGTIKTAIGLYMVDVASPDLDDVLSVCLTGSTAGSGSIAYSNTTAVTCVVPPATALVAGGDTSATFSAADFCFSGASVGTPDGTGWLPVKLTAIASGTPISNFPVDPTNDSPTATPDNTKKVYRYACQNTGAAGKPNLVFELDAVLESTAFTVTNPIMTNDGGDNTAYYETGTSLKLLPTGTNF